MSSSNSDDKPVILLVHGGWHDASTWDGVRAALGAAGYETIARTNASIGWRSPAVRSHVEDAAPVRALIDELARTRRRNVLLVGHSYGGVVLSACVDGLERRPGMREHGVVGCVFVTAFMIPRGDSLRDFNVRWSEVPGRVNAGIDPSTYEWDDRQTPTYYKIHDTHISLYNDVPKEEADEWASKLDWQAFGVMVSKIETEPWSLVPCMYVYCTEDKALPIEKQEYMVERASKDSKHPTETRVIESSHSPWLRHTPILVKYLREAAGEQLSSAEQ